MCFFDRLAKVILQECGFQPMHQSVEKLSVRVLLRLSSAAASDILLFFSLFSFMVDSSYEQVQSSPLSVSVCVCVC